MSVVADGFDGECDCGCDDCPETCPEGEECTSCTGVESGDDDDECGCAFWAGVDNA